MRHVLAAALSCCFACAPAASDNAAPDAGNAPPPFAGTWHGGWLDVMGRRGTTSTLSPTLTGTTVGGQATIDGFGEGPLAGTFDGTTFTGTFDRHGTMGFTFSVSGAFLAGPFTGSALDAVGFFASNAAPAAPATAPASLSGTWQSTKTAASGSIAISVDTSVNPPHGHVAAGSLVDGDSDFGYLDGVLGGAVIQGTTTQFLLLGSGSHFVGAYANGTDMGVIDVTAP